MPDRERLPLPHIPAVLSLRWYLVTMPNLPKAIGIPLIRYLPGYRIPAGAYVLAWGRKVSGLAAERFAARRGLPVLHAEDGFLRSVWPGREHAPYSICLDDQGVYYDARHPSRLEALAALPRSPEELDRAGRLAALWREGRISKYNHAREYRGELPESYVLVVDQTYGDGSIHHGMAGPESFTRMLETALDEHPDKTVVLKVHPEVVSGRKRGHFDLAAVARLGRVRVFSGNEHPVGLIEKAQAVYTVTSQMGFEGLLWGKPVSTFGMPFYAGWGLTRDALPPPSRRRPTSLGHLIHAALVDYPRYVDPETSQRCAPERLFAWMGLQRRQRERFPAEMAARGFPRRQRAGLRRLFQASALDFAPDASPPPAGRTVVVPHDHAPAPDQAVRVRDDLFAGAGLTFGGRGPLCALADGPGNRLEDILATAEFTPELLDRASRLRRRIVELGLTSWPREAGRFKRPADGRPLVMVVGEGPTPEADAAFLDHIRKKHSAARIIYKTRHSGLKECRLRMRSIRGSSLFDETMSSAPMHLLLSQVDAVHVRSSLAGFDAMLREKEVHCYGSPFYAGWGLTRDEDRRVDRPRSLSLNALVAGVLLLYPLYVSGESNHFSTPECIIEELHSGGSRRLRYTAKDFLALITWLTTRARV